MKTIQWTLMLGLLILGACKKEEPPVVEIPDTPPTVKFFSN